MRAEHGSMCVYTDLSTWSCDGVGGCRLVQMHAVYRNIIDRWLPQEPAGTWVLSGVDRLGETCQLGAPLYLSSIDMSTRM